MTIQDMIDLADRMNRVLVSMEHESRVYRITASKNEFGADAVIVLFIHQTAAPVVSTTIEHLNSLNDYQLYEFLTSPSVVQASGDGEYPSSST